MLKPHQDLKTPWSPDPVCPLPEYPRPQMARPGWINLNGPWEYVIQAVEEKAPETYQGTILVPYAVESALSGVQQSLLPDQKLWYRRCFMDPRQQLQNEQGSQPGGRILLHFGAVDYLCAVWVNKQFAGKHQGGYLPFSLDITDLLQAGENELVVSVWDPTDAGLQQRGKQTLKPKGIWYTAVSGIWQTVWLEAIPEISIQSIKLTPVLEDQKLQIEVVVRGLPAGSNTGIWAEASSDGKVVASGGGWSDENIELIIPDPILWEPDQPHLYDLLIQIMDKGQVLDEVASYFGMRQFALEKDAGGKMRFTLNGKPLFLYGPLDQGYFPDGLYTPPSEEAMLYDIQYAKGLGCNMIRKHIKVEPLRWYYHCDRLGMIVWQDMPNGGKIDGETVAILSMLFGFHRKDTRRLRRFGRENEDNRSEFWEELQGMVDHLVNAPCIAVWVPFNESWGQFHAREVATWLKTYDSTRLVDHASGWFDQGGGDFNSKHIYFKKLKAPKADERVFVLSEFGGYSLKILGHLWDDEKKFGYRFYDSSQELTEAYLALLRDELEPLIPQGLAAAIYTQTTDVETEINGFLTYDRKVEKMDAQVLRQTHARLIRLID